MAKFVWAVLIGILGQGLSSLGLVLMKKNNKSKTQPKEWYKNGFWWLSFLVFVCGNVSQAVALTLGSQSIIAALPVLVLVYNVIWAPLILKEKVKRQDIIAVLITVGGVVLVVLFGPRVAKDYDTEKLISYFINWTFIVYCIVVAGISIGSLLFTIFIAPKHREKVDEDDICGFFTLKNFQSKLISLSAAILPGILSSFNALFSKIIGALVSTSVKGNNQFHDWHPYVFILALIVCNVTQIVMLQKALSKFNALQIIPMYQVCLMVFSVIGGGIYFHEFKTFHNLPPHYPGLFALGLLLAIAGVFVFPKEHQDKKEFQKQEDEELPEFYDQESTSYKYNDYRIKEEEIVNPYPQHPIPVQINVA